MLTTANVAWHFWWLALVANHNATALAIVHGDEPVNRDTALAALGAYNSTVGPLIIVAR